LESASFHSRTNQSNDARLQPSKDFLLNSDNASTESTQDLEPEKA
jgi:hypothetical protein